MICNYCKINATSIVQYAKNIYTEDCSRAIPDK